MRTARGVALGIATVILLSGTAGYAGATAGGTAAGSSADPAARDHPRQADTLRGAAAEQGRFVGTALNDGLLGDTTYESIAAGEFSSVTAENEMKWESIQPQRGQFDFSGGDRLVDFAQEHDQQVHGHTLVWHSQLPAWVEHGGLAPDELRTVVEEHIAQVAGRYAGAVDRWDVVNEAFEEDGSFRQSVFYEAFGADYIADAFHAARAADPEAKLFINDYNTDGVNAKSDAMYDLVAELVADGVPIDGVGFQSHLILGQLPADFQENLQRFADLGVEVAVTELDIRMDTPSDAARLDQQADEYASLTETCLAVAACSGITVWGISDAHSWIPGTFPGEGAANLYDEEYRPKPAYDAMLAAFGGGAG